MKHLMYLSLRRIQAICKEHNIAISVSPKSLLVTARQNNEVVLTIKYERAMLEGLIKADMRENWKEAMYRNRALRLTFFELVKRGFIPEQSLKIEVNFIEP